MKQRDYLLAQHLTRVRIAEDVLQQIIPGNEPNVPKKEYLQVLMTLEKWREAMYRELEKKMDEED